VEKMLQFIASKGFAALSVFRIFFFFFENFLAFPLQTGCPVCENHFSASNGIFGNDCTAGQSIHPIDCLHAPQNRITQ